MPLQNKLAHCAKESKHSSSIPIAWKDLMLGYRLSIIMAALLCMSLLNCNLYDMYPISDMTQDRMYNLYIVHTPFLSFPCLLIRIYMQHKHDGKSQITERPKDSRARFLQQLSQIGGDKQYFFSFTSCKYRLLDVNEKNVICSRTSFDLRSLRAQK